jgi:lysophospholipase L1-like esterase
MMRRFAGLLLLWALPLASSAQEPFALKDGDRVVFLGNGVIEQEHAFGHLETRLTRRWPKANVTFRNMGWGGDTVQGLARTSGFQQPDGFARLLNEIKQAKPTVIFVGYGLNESFAGEKGLASFIRDYRKLLEQLDPLKARLILLSPTWHENLGPPFPDPTQHNKDIEKYAEAIYQIAAERKLHGVDLFAPLRDASNGMKGKLTTNGIQLSDAGYAEMAAAIDHSLGSDPTPWEMQIDHQGVAAKGFEAKRTTRSGDGWKVVIVDEVVRVPGEPLRFQWKGAPEGSYALAFDGTIAGTVSSEKLATEVVIAGPIACPEGEKLRQAIVKKGELFYRRWRPFNDHSRHWGFIGGDFKLYDDEIAALEKQIADLRVPRERVIEIKPAKGGER